MFILKIKFYKMKFLNNWKSEVALLPEYLQSYVIVYKKWKKMSKFVDNNEEIINRLNNEVIYINKVFLHYVKKLYKPNYISCFSSHKENVNDLYKFAILNKLTLYKICKRLDKRSKSHIFKSWLNDNYNNFQFNRGVYLTRLYLDNQNLDHTNDECPICFDKVTNDKPFIILSCGHFICLDCILQMFNGDKHRALLYIIFHLDEYKKKTCCPVCKLAYPLHNFSEKYIYPPKYAKSIFNKVFN